MCRARLSQPRDPGLAFEGVVGARRTMNVSQQSVVMETQGSGGRCPEVITQPIRA